MLKVCLFLCDCYSVYRSFFSQLVYEKIFNVQVDGDLNVVHDQTEAQGNEGQFSMTYLCCTLVFIDFYLCQFIISVKNARWRCNGRYC
jgi:hypothetical protein